MLIAFIILINQISFFMQIPYLLEKSKKNNKKLFTYFISS